MLKKSLLLGDGQEHFSKAVPKDYTILCLRRATTSFSYLQSPSSLQELWAPGETGCSPSSKVIKSCSVLSLTIDTDPKQLKQIQINTMFMALYTLWITQLQRSEYAEQAMLKNQPPKKPLNPRTFKWAEICKQVTTTDLQYQIFGIMWAPTQPSQKLQ